MGAPFTDFLGAPQKFAPPPPGKIPAGAHASMYIYRVALYIGR